jgi:hypothetical protein
MAYLWRLCLFMTLTTVPAISYAETHTQHAKVVHVKMSFAEAELGLTKGVISQLSAIEFRIIVDDARAACQVSRMIDPSQGPCEPSENEGILEHLVRELRSNEDPLLHNPQTLRKLSSGCPEKSHDPILPNNF